MVFKVVLLRNAESRSDTENLFTGWYDSDLSEKGKLEAVRAGKVFQAKGFKFDVVFTSILRRAIHTAWTVLINSENFSMPIVNSWRLNERHYGDLQGLSKDEAVKKHGDKQVDLWRSSFDTSPPEVSTGDARHPSNDSMYAGLPRAALPTAESLQMIEDRVLPYWNDNIAPCVMAGKSVLVVAHGGSLPMICKSLEGMTKEQAVKEVNDMPCGVPLVYELDEKMSFVKKYYLQD
ncbi:unnamed protein product [Polarella glacialis]|uniref:phosphoglycerate mutase (2,3-diphosphoglycerate-dependent) n=1 Tax=Polarella glacialis TaxID=89957 RepID=A0A813FGW6_POLGL|nr:unnamed protein product [Polarella glacialis]CAE8645687.1 unnamed protein product [Polarella glacialis]